MGFAADWKISSWLAVAFSDWFGVSVMFDTSFPSRDDPCLKEYSMMFPNKLNTQEFLLCALNKYWCVSSSWNTRSSPSIFLCFNTAISNLTRSTENNCLRENQTHIHQSSLNPPDRATTISLSSKSARSRHYYIAKSARSRHYYLAKSTRSRPSCVQDRVRIFYRVMPTHDLNAILYPPSSENTVGCIAV